METTSSDPVQPAPSADAIEFDLSKSKRLANLTDLLRRLSGAADQSEATAVFIDNLRAILDRKAFLFLDTTDLVEQNFRVKKLVAADGRDLSDSVVVDEHGVSTGGLIGQVMEQAQSRVFADLNLRDDPVFGTQLLMYRSAMAVPMYRGGKVGGWMWAFGFQPESFSERDVTPFILRANVFGSTITMLEHAGRLEASDGAGATDTQRIAAVQRALTERGRPDLRGIELAISHEPVERPGGDYHLIYEPDRDEAQTTESRFGILLADVRGSGPAGSMVYAMIDAFIATYPQEGRSAADVLGALNGYLCARKIEGVTVRALLSFYNNATRRLEYATADAPLPLIRRPHFRGEIEIMALDVSNDVALGVNAEAAFESGSFKLAPDDTVLFHSDGVSGARNRDGEMLGTGRLETAMKISSGGPQDVIDRVQRAVREHEANQEQHDDQTLIALRIHY